MEAYRLYKGINFDENEVEELFHRIDADGSSEIDYQEWCMTAVSRDKFLSKEKLEQAFSMFD